METRDDDFILSQPRGISSIQIVAAAAASGFRTVSQHEQHVEHQQQQQLQGQIVRTWGHQEAAQLAQAGISQPLSRQPSSSSESASVLIHSDSAGDRDDFPCIHAQIDETNAVLFDTDIYIASTDGSSVHGNHRANQGPQQERGSIADACDGDSSTPPTPKAVTAAAAAAFHVRRTSNTTSTSPSTPGGTASHGRSSSTSAETAAAAAFEIEMQEVVSLTNNVALLSVDLGFCSPDDWYHMLVVDGDARAAASLVQHMMLKYSKRLANFFLESGCRPFDRAAPAAALVQAALDVVLRDAPFVFGEDVRASQKYGPPEKVCAPRDPSSVVNKLRFLHDFLEFCRRKHRLLGRDPLEDFLEGMESHSRSSLVSDLLRPEPPHV